MTQIINLFDTIIERDIAGDDCSELLASLDRAVMAYVSNPNKWYTIHSLHIYSNTGLCVSYLNDKVYTL